MHSRIHAHAILLACLAFLAASAPAADVAILFSADTEGHTSPCRICPTHTGLGGLDRRASLIAAQRNQSPAILVDAGNFLFGPDSLPSRGKVIADAYAAMSYNAVNLSYRDFRLGKAQTLKLIGDAKLPAISANLVADGDGSLLARPYIVKAMGSQRVAVLGITEPPAGLEYLPHLKEQLDGVRIMSPADALTTWLPKAKAESDRVVLLYYGSLAGLEPIRAKFGPDLAAICVGGVRPELIPENVVPPLVATSEHGKHLAAVRLSDAGKASISQLEVGPTLERDPAVAKLVDQSP